MTYFRFAIPDAFVDSLFLRMLLLSMHRENPSSSHSATRISTYSIKWLYQGYTPVLRSTTSVHANTAQLHLALLALAGNGGRPHRYRDLSVDSKLQSLKHLLRQLLVPAAFVQQV